MSSNLPNRSVRADLLVAATATLAAFAATGVVELLFGVELSLLAYSTPLFVYFLYAFTRKGGPYASFDTPRVWAGLAVVAGVAVVGYAVV